MYMVFILPLISSVLMGWICLIGCSAGSIYASMNFNVFKIVTGAIRAILAGLPKPFNFDLPRSVALEEILR